MAKVQKEGYSVKIFKSKLVPRLAALPTRDLAIRNKTPIGKNEIKEIKVIFPADVRYVPIVIKQDSDWLDF